MWDEGQFVAGWKALGSNIWSATKNLAVHNPITQAYLQVSDTVMTGPANRFLGKNWGMQSEMGKAADRGAGKMEMAAHAIKGPTEVMAAAVTGHLAGKLVGAVEGALASKAATAQVWPPNRGFLNSPNSVELQPGSVVDRFGEQEGRLSLPRVRRSRRDHCLQDSITNL